MIFQNIDFHNVEEIVQEEGERGYRLYRFPKALAEKIAERADRANKMSTGIELRFKLKSEKAVLKLYHEFAEEAQAGFIYFGSFQGGWYSSSFVIGEEETAVEIKYPGSMEKLKSLTIEQELGFDPEVVRIVLPYGNCLFVGIEGEVEAPSKEDYPRKTYLAYGSSITHGSLALAQPYSYPFQIAQKFHHDYLNLGMPGCCHLQKEMAEYIKARKDWDFMSVEMGINMLGDFDEEAFEGRVKDWLAVMAPDKRPVFVTNMFCTMGNNTEKMQNFREIVRQKVSEYGDRFVFTEGLWLMGQKSFVSADMTHPSLEGIREIADHWYAVMRASLS